MHPKEEAQAATACVNVTNDSASILPEKPDAFWSASEATLVARLSRRGPEPLARFILTLVNDDNGIGDYVRAFLESDSVPRCATVLESSIDKTLAGERPYDRRHALDAVFLRRLDHVLDTIEAIILPVAPATACTLLKRVIEGRDAIENQLPEADTEPTFVRAHNLLRRAAAAGVEAEGSSNGS